MNVLLSHIAETRRRFIRVEKKLPKILALGRWDVRELARFVTGACNPDRDGVARAFIRTAREAAAVNVEFAGHPVEVKVDGRIGRMPGALWWQ